MVRADVQQPVGHVSAAPVRVAPPVATKQSSLTFCAVCQLRELDAIAQVDGEVTSMTTATIRPQVRRVPATSRRLPDPPIAPKSGPTVGGIRDACLAGTPVAATRDRGRARGG